MSYDYFGLELTPSIFEKLLIQFYDGKQFSRQDAVETITKFHREKMSDTACGGYAITIEMMLKSCKLQILKKKNLAT